MFDYFRFARDPGSIPRSSPVAVKTSCSLPSVLMRREPGEVQPPEGPPLGPQFSAMTRRSRPISGGASSSCAKPAHFEMLSSTAKAYVSPAGVVASIIMLKTVAVDGGARSGLETRSTIAARPLGFSAACTLRLKVAQVGGSKWCRKLAINTRSCPLPESVSNVLLGSR